MESRKSGRGLAEDNVGRFLEWIAERDAAQDWQDYERGGKLNRTEIAGECEFALSVLRQNPGVRKALEALEKRLKSSGQLAASHQAGGDGGDEESVNAVERRIARAESAKAIRLKTLEEQNAALRAEVEDLRSLLAKYKLISEHLEETGRLLQP